jgi:hypothetical protein
MENLPRIDVRLFSSTLEVQVTVGNARDCLMPDFRGAWFVLL